MFEAVSNRLRYRRDEVLEPALELAIEIAREGAEGRRIGSLFTVGDSDMVLARSRPLIMDPVALHPESARRITDPNLRGTVKELAQLDGAFVISDQGIVVAACRYLDAMTAGVDIPLGLGSRHLAAASMTLLTNCVAIVVSETSVIRIFEGGLMIAEILPELWALSRRVKQDGGAESMQQVGDLAVVFPDHRRRQA
jgi:DNA integrity scanning protein DisA with diadenylate cyclase activity